MRTKSHRRHQKMYNMKGCSSFFRSTKKRSSHAKKRSSRNKSMKGGCGEMCPMNHSMIGGYLRKHSSASMSNEKRKRSQNQNSKKSSDKSSTSSSRHSRHSHSRTPSSQMGGGLTLIPQDVTNLFRSIGFTTGGVYNSAYGYRAPVNPAPYADQFKSSFGSKL